MNAPIARGLAACLVGLVVSGCSANGETIRGQNPYEPAQASLGNRPAVAAGQPYPAGTAASPKKKRIVYIKKNSGAPVRTVSAAGHPHHVPQRVHHPHGATLHPGCPPGACPHGHCPPGHCGHHLLGQYGWQPRHNHLYSHHAPGGELRYPPPALPAGVTVYPYYTVKGPDDFFLQ